MFYYQFKVSKISNASKCTISFLISAYFLENESSNTIYLIEIKEIYQINDFCSYKRIDFIVFVLIGNIYKS